MNNALSNAGVGVSRVFVRAAFAGLVAVASLAGVAGAQTCDRDVRDLPGPFPLGGTNTPNLTLNHTFTGGYAIGSICVAGTVERLAGGTRASDLRLTIFRNNTIVVSDQPLSINGDTSAGGLVPFVASFAAAGAGPGLYRFVFRDAVDQPGEDVNLRDIRLAATVVGASGGGGGGGGGNGPDLPPLASLDFRGSGFQSYPTQFLRGDVATDPPVGERFNAPTAWYIVSLPDDYNRFTGRYLDLTTAGSGLVVRNAQGVPEDLPPVVDVVSLSSCFYRENGQLIAADSFSGRDLTTALSFGVGSSLDVNLQPGDLSVIDPYDRFFSGGDGGDLSRGTYFIGISQFETVALDNSVVQRTGPRRQFETRVRLRARWGERPIVLPAIPVARDLGLNPTILPRELTMAADEVQWFSFRASQINQFQRGWMDISTNQTPPTINPLASTTLLVYGPGGRYGNRADFDSGFGALSFLSLGSGSQTPASAAVGDAFNFLGQPFDVFSNGFSGSLDDQLYYLAVMGTTYYASPFGFAQRQLYGNYWTIRVRDSYIEPTDLDFNTLRTAATAGTIRLTVTSGTKPAPGGSAPGGAEDLGTLNIGQVVRVFGLGPDYGDTTVKWYRFSNERAASIDNRRYVDIWTSEVLDDPLTGGDTILAIFAPNGAMIDDDNAAVGDYAALTFGADIPIRQLDNDSPLDGRDGVLPTGLYYIGVGSYPGLNLPSLFNQAFVVTTSQRNAEDTGLVRLTINAGITTSCGASDIAGNGQTDGADGELTSDDLIVFVNRFVTRDARSDVASSGQIRGADGEWTADDIIIFINDFVNPPAGCGQV